MPLPRGPERPVECRAPKACHCPECVGPEASAKLVEGIRQLVDRMPPFTPEQKARLRFLLRP